MTITVQLTITDELCKDLLTCAYEGGSAYWLACERVEREKPSLNVIKIIGCYDREDEDTQWGLADIETMRQGIARILNPEFKISSSIRADLLLAVTDPDSVAWDAETADCVLQAGLLGELVYG